MKQQQFTKKISKIKHKMLLMCQANGKTSEASAKKTKRNGSKNAYISQNESKIAREGEINGLQGAKRVYTKQNALKTPQISVQAGYLRQSEARSKQFYCGKSVF